ncbi:hypothetical protein KKI24_01930, partial [bacterium]|nr:hypothetical protein [bacterium]
AAVVIQIDEKLDRHTIPTLHEVCRRHFESQPPREITIEICRLDSISIEGKDYLRDIKDQVRFSNIPEFLRLELETNDNPVKAKPGIRK